MSIPLFFKAWEFSNKYPNDHLYVDGGLVYNYPLSFFDKPRFQNNNKGTNKESLGLYLESKSYYDMHDNKENSVNNEKVGNSSMSKIPYENQLSFKSKITSYIKHSFETLLNAQDIDFMEESHLVERTIFISDLGYSATDFDLVREDLNLLVESGCAGAKKYLEWVDQKSKIKQNTN